MMNKSYQPHEGHIPYLLQLFIDYNLYGMNLLNVAAVKFRRSSKPGETVRKIESVICSPCRCVPLLFTLDISHHPRASSAFEAFHLKPSAARWTHCCAGLRWTAWAQPDFLLLAVLLAAARQGTTPCLLSYRISPDRTLASGCRWSLLKASSVFHL